MIAPKFIQNSELLFSHFNYWPTFHDDEVVSMKFQREETSLQIEIDSALMTDKHCLITILFKGIKSIDLKNFNHQNVIFEMHFSKNNSNIEVVLDSSFGLYFQLICECVVVKSCKKKK
jgi:hypothetical protein